MPYMSILKGTDGKWHCPGCEHLKDGAVDRMTLEYGGPQPTDDDLCEKCNKSYFENKRARDTYWGDKDKREAQQDKELHDALELFLTKGC